MAIPVTRYVDITSGVAGASAVSVRDNIGRLFTSNALVPPQEPLEYSTLTAVGAQFGTSSEEYDRAALYFGWVSPLITKAPKISFGRYTPSATAPQVHGNTNAKSLATYTAISAGTLTLDMGGYEAEFTGIDLSGEVSLAAVAAAIELLIQGESYGGTMFTSATVDYVSGTRRFVLTGGDTGEAVISVSGTVADALGWTTGETVCYGSDAQEPVDALIASADQSDNFFTFLFMDTITNDQKLAIAEWVAAENVRFQYCVGTAAASAGTIQGVLDGQAGSGITITDSQYEEMCQMIVVAATDYERRNGVMSPMFKQFPTLEPTVTTETDADTYDAIRVNYIGQTQSAGQQVSFYQTGVLQGGDTDPLDINTYANEQWLKSASTAAILNLLLSQGQVSASGQGRALVLNALQSVVDDAVFNGVIVTEKELTNEQKAFVTLTTGDDTAWQQVQSIGYWMGVTITTDIVGGVTRYIAEYTLIYAKADAIRKVEGTHALL